jgi:tRNA A-37 threonylcarbamoyl transferase component Bud32
MTSTLGPYEIRGRLGAGAMAVVWRAWDPKLEREVAIKEPVRSPAMSDSIAGELGERFVREGKTAARLSHPGIVTIYTADVFDGRPAIVMELLRGHSLAALIDKRSLPLDAALSILDQLLDALDYAHTMGVVHRDVKPDNVIVTDDGRVKLTDFGVAHASRVDSGPDSIIAGTPGYMAPEQINALPVDARADVFGLGALAYEMFTGHNPFGATDGLDTTSIMYRTTHGSPPPFDGSARVPQPLQSVVFRALAASPADRFASAGEMRLELRNAASGASAGTGSLAELVDGAGPGSMPGVSFTKSTLGKAIDKIPEKASGGWVVGAALAAAGGVLVMLALLSGSGTSGVGVLIIGGLAIGGVYWYATKHSNLTGAELPPEAVLMSAGLRGAASGLEVRLRGPQEDRVVQVSLPCIVGRSGDAQLVIGDDLASRQHALIERRGDDLMVSDLGSRNGTYLDGDPVAAPTPIRPGAIVTVGSTEIICVAEGTG